MFCIINTMRMSFPPTSVAYFGPVSKGSVSSCKPVWNTMTAVRTIIQLHVSVPYHGVGTIKVSGPDAGVMFSEQSGADDV